jgi:hypothetical protein
MKSRQVKHDGETGKKEGERVREREREQHSGERKQRGLILTVGLNQQHLRISTTPENFLKVSNNNNNGRIGRQSSFGVAFNILRLFWLYNIRSNNTESTTTLRIRNLWENDKFRSKLVCGLDKPTSWDKQTC